MLGGLYAGSFLVISILFYRAVRSEITLTAFVTGCFTFTVIVQAFLFYFFGTSAIKKAVQRDFTTDMISSHRMSAMSGYIAAIGYLTGPTAQVMALTAVNWLVCNTLVLILGVGPSNLLIGPTILFMVMSCMALLFWSMAVLVALATRGGTTVIGVVVLIAVLSNSGGLQILPGLRLLIAGTEVIRLGQANYAADLANTLVVSMIAQLTFSLLFFLAAARKFARDDVPAFNPLLAHSLVAASAVLCALALRFWSGAFLSNPDPMMCTPVQLVATLSALALVACLPVANGAWNEAAWTRRRAKDPQDLRPRPRSFLESPILVTLIVFGILTAVLSKGIGEIQFGFSDQTSLSRLAWLPVTFFLAMLSLGGLLRYAYSVVAKGLLIAVLYLVFCWAIPPFADLAIDSMRAPVAAGQASQIFFNISPVGTWITICGGYEAPLGVGLAAQFVIAAGALYLAGRSRDRVLPADRSANSQA